MAEVWVLFPGALTKSREMTSGSILPRDRDRGLSPGAG